MLRVTLLAALAGLIVACAGGGDSSAPAPAPAPSGPAPSAPAESPIAPVTFEYANPVAEGDAQAYAKTVGPWMDLVTSATDGAVTFRSSHGGSLLTHADMFEGVGGGLADLGSAQVSLNPTDFPLWVLSGMHDPELGSRIDAYQQTMITRLMMDAVPDLEGELEASNIKMLFSIASSPHHLLTRFPFAELDDLRGKQIRTYGRFMPTLFESAGATPVTLPPNEIYSAFDRGVVDGAYTLPAAFVGLGIYEVAEQLTLVGNGTTPPLNAGFHLTINRGVWESLDNRVKVAMLEAARQMERQYSQSDVPSDEAAAIVTMREAGLTIAEMSDADIARWSAAYPDLWTPFAAELDAAGLAGTALVRTYLELVTLEPGEIERRYDALWDAMIAQYR